MTTRILVLIDDDSRRLGVAQWSFPNAQQIGNNPIMTIRPDLDLPDISASADMLWSPVGSVRVGLRFDAWPGEDGNHDIYTWQLVPRLFRR